MRLIGMAVLAVLAGCTFGPSGGGRGLEEVTTTRATGEFVPPARRYLGLSVRSFEPDTEAEWREVAGATCAVSAGAYRATLVTPARLILPDLGPDAPPIEAECRLGSRSGRDIVGPVYRWPAETKPDPLQRIWYGGWWRGYEESGPMRYPDLAVGLQ